MITNPNVNLNTRSDDVVDHRRVFPKTLEDQLANSARANGVPMVVASSYTVRCIQHHSPSAAYLITADPRGLGCATDDPWVGPRVTALSCVRICAAGSKHTC